MTAFEWDAEKDASNLRKHGVTLDEARTVFGDIHALTWFDEQHSDQEDRYLTVGFASSGTILIVSHTECDDTTRLISARPATKRERQFYADARR